jgi:predicted RNA binding protein YcfA (HicA-like mRNA interferase family)
VIIGSIPVLKPGEVCRWLEAVGLAAVRQRSSHGQNDHADGQGTTAPLHTGRDVAAPQLRQIAKSIAPGWLVTPFRSSGGASEPIVTA